MFELSTLSIQTFDDCKERGLKLLAQIFPYTPDRIKELQDKGAGIFFPVNPQIEPTLRGVDNTAKLAALALDLDICKEAEGLTEAERLERKRGFGKKLRKLPIQPNYIIITKNGLQPVWEFENPRKLKTVEERRAANEEYKLMVLGVCASLGHSSEGDNLARVLRFPKTFHLKNPHDPFEIDCKEFSTLKPMIEEFKEAYPPTTKNKKPLEDIVNGVEKGRRNVSATVILGSELAIHKITDFESIVWPLFKAWNKECPEPQEESVIRDMFERFAAKETAKRQGHINTQEDLVSKFEAEAQDRDFKIFSKFETLDKSIDGFRSGATYIFAGLKKSGKSTILMNVVNNILKQSIKCGFVNTELSYGKFAERFTAINNNIPVKDVSQDQIKNWLSEIQGKLFYCDKQNLQDSNGLSLSKAKTIFTDWVDQGVKLIIFDNLTTIGTESSGNKMGWQLLANFLDELIDFSKDKNITTFAVIHLKPYLIFAETPQGIRHMVEENKLDDIFKKSITVNKRPTSADLYGGGGALSQISGGVLLLWRPFQDFNDPFYRAKTMLILEDFRDGAKITEIEMNFEAEKLQFKEAYPVELNFNELVRDREERETKND